MRFYMPKKPTITLAAASAWMLATPPAAAQTMTCAQAMTLESEHPGIETTSILSIIARQWQAMDQQTLAHNAQPITPAMTAGPTYFNMLSAQCEANPGQTLHAAAAQVYRIARSALDGF